MLRIMEVTSLHLQNPSRLFADDTTLLKVRPYNSDPTKSLETDLEKIDEWTNLWKMQLNPDKTEHMTVSLGQNHICPNLKINNIPVKSVQEHKHLGLNFNKSAHWESHIQSLVAKAGKQTNILKSFKYKLSRKVLETLYKAFIRPIMEYSSSVWDCLPEEQAQMLEKIQINAARTVTGATVSCSKEKLYLETGWATLKTAF